MKKEKLREKSYREKKIRGTKFLQKIDKNYKEIEKDIDFSMPTNQNSIDTEIISL